MISKNLFWQIPELILNHFLLAHEHVLPVEKSQLLKAALLSYSLSLMKQKQA